MSVRRIGACWWVDFQYERFRYRKRSPLNTRHGALAYEITLRSRLARGEPVYLAGDRRIRLTERRPPFAAFADEWLRTYVTANLRPATQVGYRRALRRVWLPRFGDRDLKEITAQAIDEAKVELLATGISPKTVNNDLVVLRRCLACALEEGLIPKLPSVRWLKCLPPPFDFLSPAESSRLVAAAPSSELRLFLLCALRTGMRAGELCGLRWEDVDLGRRTLTVRHSLVRGIDQPPKSGRIRHLPIADDLHAALAAAERRGEHVFMNVHGAPFSYRVARKRLDAALRRAGLRPIGLHVLRHTFASQLASEGVPVLTIQALLGHSAVEMTQRYAHLAPSTLVEAVNVLSDAEDRLHRDEALPPAAASLDMTSFSPVTFGETKYALES